MIRNSLKFKVTHDDIFSFKTSCIDKDYKISKEILGKGSYGEVRACICKKTKLKRAVKIMNKIKYDEKEVNKIKKEVTIMKNCDHPNIIKVYDLYENVLHFYIVMELCTGGELYERVID